MKSLKSIIKYQRLPSEYQTVKSLKTYTHSQDFNLLKLTRTEWGTVNANPSDSVDFDYNKLYYMAGSGYIRPNPGDLSETITDHSVAYTQTSSSWWGIGFPIQVKPSTKYTLGGKQLDGNITKLVYTLYDNDGHFQSYGQWSANVSILEPTVTITTTATTKTLIVLVCGTTNGASIYASDLQVVEGQTLPAFQPYGKGAVKSIGQNLKDLN